jgi:hypothetical protein
MLMREPKACSPAPGHNLPARSAYPRLTCCALTKQTSNRRLAMSAFGSKADMTQTRCDVRFLTRSGHRPRMPERFIRRSFAAFAFTGRGLSWPSQMPGQRQLSLRKAALPQILPILPLPSPRTDASVRHISYKCVSRCDVCFRG